MKQSPLPTQAMTLPKAFGGFIYGTDESACVGIQPWRTYRQDQNFCGSNGSTGEDTLSGARGACYGIACASHDKGVLKRCPTTFVCGEKSLSRFFGLEEIPSILLVVQVSIHIQRHCVFRIFDTTRYSEVLGFAVMFQVAGRGKSRG